MPNTTYSQVTISPLANFSLNTIYIGGTEFNANSASEYVFTNVDNSRIAAMLSQGWTLVNVS
jgi:hypothetical protein